jgi:hypothetical protein
VSGRGLNVAAAGVSRAAAKQGKSSAFLLDLRKAVLVSFAPFRRGMPRHLEMMGL